MKLSNLYAPIHAAVCGILLVVTLGAGSALAVTRPADVTVLMTNQPLANFGKLPLAFEANAGQTDGRVKFLAHGSGYTLFLTGNEAVLTLSKPPRAPAHADEPSRTAAPSVVRMKLLGANLDAAVIGAAELPGKSNYLIGRDPKQWRTNVPNYAQVQYSDVYPGVDLVYYGTQGGQLEYDFVVAPGSDPSAIKLNVAAADVGPQRAKQPPLEIAADGDLIVKAPDGEIRFHKPILYQSESLGARSGAGAGRSVEVQGRFVLTASNQVSFAVGPYDHTKALIIDPVLVYSTYLSGTFIDVAYAIAVDSAGSAYVTGLSQSTNFPTVNPYQATNHGANVFVSKFNAAGSALVYSTFLGGHGQDEARGIAVDSAGNAYLTGVTSSTDFPTMNPFQATNHGNTGSGAGNAFVSKFDAAGSALIYSTYLGGSESDIANAIAIDSAGNAYVTGNAYSTDFPTVNPLQPNHKGTESNAFVSKFNAAGSALVYSTYLGGSAVDKGNGIAVDSSGSAYVTGSTDSIDFPTMNPFQATNGGQNVFVSKFNPAGSALVYSTYLGGNFGDFGYGIAVDSAGDAYVTGSASSTNFPTVNPFQATRGGPSPNVFVSKFNAAGSALVYSTYLGGNGGDYQAADAGEYGYGIAVDSDGNAYVTGSTSSGNFPTVNPVQATNNTRNGTQPGVTAFVSQFDPAGSALAFSTYLGGSGTDTGYGIAVDSSGSAYVTGSTSSTDFRTTANAFQTIFLGQEGAFVSKLPPAGASSSLPTVTITAAPTTVTLGQSATLTWVSTHATSCTASGAWIGAQATSGSHIESPTAIGSSTYTLTCSGSGGSANASAVVTVSAAAPIVTLMADPTSITVGQSATLTWSSTNATSCTASGVWTGTQATSGSHIESPTAIGNSTYTLTCSGAGGSANASTVVTVSAAAVPTVTLSVNPTSITVGQSATLTWVSTNAASCTASGAWSGTQAKSGSLAVTPTAAGTLSYALTCSGSTSTSAASVVTVTVNAQVAAVTVLSGKAGGGSMDLWSLLGLGLLLAWRMRLLRPVGLGTFAVLAAGAMLGAAAPASAQDAVQFNWNQTYVGLRAGSSAYWESSGKLDADLVAEGQTGTTTSIDQHRAGGVVYAGVPFYKALSLELGFADLGVYHVGISTTSTNIPQLAQTIIRNLAPAGRGLTLNLAAPLDISPWFAVEPRLGVLGYQSKQEVYTPLGTFSHDRDGAGFDAGLALLLRPASSINVGVGFDCFGIDGRCGVMLYSAEIEYHFGR